MRNFRRMRSARTGSATSAEATLAALETSKERKTSEIRTSLGESHEQSLRLASHINGDSAGAQDFGSARRSGRT